MNLADLTWPAIEKLDRRTPVVIPVAALEQHGHHLPVFTDSMLLGEIVRRAAERIAGRVLVAPLFWLGNSDHHLEFCGTFSAPPRVYIDLLCGMAENLLGHGFRRIVFINGHGGNDVPGRQAVFELRQRHRRLDDCVFLFATYWALGLPPASSGLVQREMGHACEWETSMMLRLAPHLVGDFASEPDVSPSMPFDPVAQGWITRERTERGHIGSPRFASAEKGEALFEHFAAQAVAFFERIAGWDGKFFDA
jgi:creatinine amidohydrolase